MKKVIALTLVVLLSSSLAYAACDTCANLKTKTGTMDTMGARFCNGLCNAALGWSEIFYRPGKEVAAGKNPIEGFFRGLGNAIERTTVGVARLVTCLIPGDEVIALDDCPLCAYK